MSSVERIHSAADNVDDVQSALAAVRAGLEAAEVVAEGVEEARRTHLLLKLAVVFGLVAIVALVIARRRSADDDT